MRRLILQTGISIDGYLAALDKSHPWGCDEYRLLVQPAALGSGLPLFKDPPSPLHLELVEATTYPSGVAIHIYRPRSRPSGRNVDQGVVPATAEGLSDRRSAAC